MISKLPFFKFDCHDWMTGKIQLCDMKTQGIFINICTMIWCEKGFLKNDRFLHRKLGIEKQVLSDALECFFELGIMEEKDGF
ncbi:MAG: YdaU family protein, partial [Lentisphaerae bacterium]|nr:YdaU family protein [Lentisphaerota bacterium]